MVMSKESWNDVVAGLRKRRASETLPDADAFKADFKARAVLVRQGEFESGPVLPVSLVRWVVACAAAIAMLVGGTLLWPVSEELVTQVKSLQVMAPHSGVMIMNDDAGRGTVVWVTDMTSNDESKG
jgi:hypothetical protein